MAMKIPPNVQALGSLYGMTQTSTAKVRRDKVAQHGSAGKYEISKEAQNFSAVLEKIRSHSNDVRLDKVHDLEQRIADGSYYVSDDDLAAAIIDMRF